MIRSAGNHAGSLRSWFDSPFFVVPLVAGFFAGAAVSHRLPEPQTVAQLIEWWVVTIVVASIAATIVDRIARRYLPLSTLLKMTMLFPNEAPSRLKVARRSGSIGELKKRIASVSAGGDRSAGEAAELILSLSAALGGHDRASADTPSGYVPTST